MAIEIKNNKNKKTHIILSLVIMLGIMMMTSCSRAYKPTNIPKKKRNCGDCSRWSYNDNQDDIINVSSI